MTGAELGSALAALNVPGIDLAFRRIAPGDERHLLPPEAGTITTKVLAGRAASGAARAAARELFERLGEKPVALPKGPDGAPLWPAGFTGSLAHDGMVAVAALARTVRCAALGLDVEPAEPLPAEVLEIVATAGELAPLHPDPCAGRIAFAAKEAVYKALHPLDGVRLEYADITLDFRPRLARTRTGRVLEFRWAVADHVVALAFLRTAEQTIERSVA